MQQVVHLWQSLGMRRRAIVLGATLAMFAAVLGLARMASQPGLSLLYAGLESGAAGEIVTALEQRGVAYAVRGDAIFVESTRRDELRMTLAGEGLPNTSGQGYELLDGLSGFGTTSQMFDAAYWRAKEGELARTIVSHPAIASARVHISNAGSNPFRSDIRPSASVSVTMSGGALSPRHARALQFLVASAVAGLSPENVAVIDADGGLIGAAEEVPANGVDDRAGMLRQQAARLLEARVGPGNAVVEVTVETVTQSESIRERRVDPQSRVAISTESEERVNSASGGVRGDVTVASNLPDGDAEAGEGSSSSANETRERVNYEVSATEREITHGPGAIRRLSVAVLVNGIETTDAAGARIVEPRPEDELVALRDLVASAVGLDEARGDVITIRSLPFEAPDPGGSTAVSSLLDRVTLDLMSLIQIGVLAAVVIVLGLFVIRPLLLSSAAGVAPQLPSPARAREQTGRAMPAAALTGEIDDGDLDESGLSVVSGGHAALARPDSRTPLDRASEDPVARLRELIGHRQEETVEILRSWLEGEEERV